MQRAIVLAAIIPTLVLASPLAYYAPGGAQAAPGGDTTSGASLVGDVDCGGVVNSVDAALILQYEAGLVAQFSCPDAADTNQDGIINAIDASLVLQYGAALIDDLPPFVSPTPTPCPCGLR
jgi:hypothetical protein